MHSALYKLLFTADCEDMAIVWLLLRTFKITTAIAFQ